MAAPNPADFEKLGALFIGRERESGELLLLDSKDLTTHAVCVGMTGSGKTGLCIDLLEEAALDGVPAIAIDPKGDLSNLLLTFPQLRPEDFAPWIDEGEASAQGKSVQDAAAAAAKTWRDGLAAWGEDGARIERLRRAAEALVWTPGSTAGLPLSILRSFAAPSRDEMEDAEALRDRLVATSSGLLALAGVDSDPLRGRESVLLQALLQNAWAEGRSLDLGALIGEIRKPPIARVGVVDVDSFYPEKERFELAMALNALAASPSFAAWAQGDPIDVGKLLRTPDGRPRLSIVSIAHLSDAERMFFVTLLLHEIVAWTRRQSGTSSLRALVYMDEVFGYLPPTANPPSKQPLLTLLKQARAFGVGIVLATQNPVDLDYKALSNAGTWMLGRLQTERDKLRVLDGLEGASSTAGRAFDRAHADSLLSSLGKRMFLLASAHEDVPVVFESRWALSYLRGPLTRTQLASLMASKREAAPPAPSIPASSPAGSSRPVMPPGVTETFLARRAAGTTTYRARLLARARLHHVSAGAGIDTWRDVTLLFPLPEAGSDDAWSSGEALASPVISSSPEDGARFEPPAASITSASMTAWTKSLTSRLLSDFALTLHRCDPLDATSRPGESEADFRGRLAQEARERRDLAVQKLRAKHAPAAQRLQERLRKAQQRVQVQRDQASHQRTSAVLSAGTAILGALLGGGRRGTISRAATAARGFGRASQEGNDVDRAEADVEQVKSEIAQLDEQVAAEVQELESVLDPTTLVVSDLKVPARKGDVSCSLSACWTPWVAGEDGLLRPGWLA